jgi:2,4'-dihydroxyacetophenone dioxygenase
VTDAQAGTGEIVGSGAYVYEPPGTIDGRWAIGDEPCVIHIQVAGAIEYLGPNGDVSSGGDRCTT